MMHDALPFTVYGYSRLVIQGENRLPAYVLSASITNEIH